MVAVTAEPPVTEDVAWFRIDDRVTAGTARRAAAALAERLGFSGSRGAEVGLATMELASNLHKHADRGSLLLREVRTGDTSAVEVATVDHGPGMSSTGLAFLDGHSTTGTLGIGLGAVRRLADATAVRSGPDGTVLTALFTPGPGPVPREPFAGVTRPMTGEGACGDAYAVRRDGGRLGLLLCDGSGHGPLAATASALAVRAFLGSAPTAPDAMVRRLHEAMSGSRGGAVAVAELDQDRGVVRYAGLGNIGGSVVAERRRGMVSLPGIAGYQARSVRMFEYPLPPGAVVVLHSDGLTDRWELAPGLGAHPPLVVALTLLRDAGVRRDDASVLVARAERA
ncbi:Anti-sigma B factor RsbT [Actinokineospora spheciospongiae]|uniref:Anti-sigma B factor RsbT n=1 Tax=Actinokineospora spheciospongiae TaxID=909613 RepID=W7J3D5_9PSEU|nr:SpoIIE family protein phosphatase [Actinokineospora spheciospongiae]EWC60634.1 Anti-sigma B factor RsbT [Actinokineospora spheciospongiae]